MLGIAACTPSVPVNTNYDQTADFTEYKTYSWEPTEPGYVMTLTDTRVREAVNRNLVAKGFQEIRDGEGDLIVFYQTTKDEVRLNDGRYGWWKTGKGVPEIEFKDGTLILEFVDPVRERHVWQGVADDATTGLGEDPSKLNYSVDKLLHKFPPGQRPR
jgi:hypothetical protein